MPNSDYSNNYLLYNAENTKNIVIVVEIEGVNTFLSSSTIYKKYAMETLGFITASLGLFMAA